MCIRDSSTSLLFRRYLTGAPSSRGALHAPPGQSIERMLPQTSAPDVRSGAHGASLRCCPAPSHTGAWSRDAQSAANPCTCGASHGTSAACRPTVSLASALRWSTSPQSIVPFPSPHCPDMSRLHRHSRNDDFQPLQQCGVRLAHRAVFHACVNVDDIARGVNTHH